MRTFNFSIATLTLVFSCYVKQTFTSTCDKKEQSNMYLDVAMDLISKAKENYPVCSNTLLKPMDCEEVERMGFSESGIYRVYPHSRVMDVESIAVYCDMQKDEGGWTVIQRRGNFMSPKDYFFKDWSSYKKGFGNLEKDFWLGNDYIFALTNQRLSTVRFDLVDVAGESRYATYGTFWIDDEAHNYTLHIKEYSGNAGDSMTTAHNNRQFSTKDRDNDQNSIAHCAQNYKGAWWYGACHHSNLNGLYHRGKHTTNADGVNWKTFRFHNESLETTEIKIRPKYFQIRPKETEKVSPDLKLHENPIRPKKTEAVSPDLKLHETPIRPKKTEEVSPDSKLETPIRPKKTEEVGHDLKLHETPKD